MSLRTSFFPSFITTYLNSFQGLRISAWHGIAINGIQSIVTGIIYFLTLYFVKHLKFSIFQAGILIACYGAGTIFGALLGGKLSDKFSAGRICIFALLVESLGYFALIHNINFYYLILNLFFIGIAAYGFITANTVWVLEKCQMHENERLKALNLLNVASNFGLGCSAFFISFLSFNDFHFLFMLISFILLIIAFYMRWCNKHHVTEKIKKQNQSQQINHTAQQSIIIYVLFSLFLMGIIISQINSTYPVFLSDTFPSMGMKSFSELFILNSLLVVFLQTIIVDRVQHLNKILLISMSVAMLSAGLFVLSFIHIFSLAMIAMIIMTMGEIIFFSISQSLCYEKSPDNKKGTNLGMYRMIFAMSRIAGPFLGSFIYESCGSSQLWYFCFILGIISITPALFLFKFV